jgi:DnaJ-class molecular chaperone
MTNTNSKRDEVYTNRDRSKRTYTCDRCQGNGFDPQHRGDDCHQCGGTGLVLR